MRKMLAAVAVVLSACSSSVDTQRADQAVSQFHQMLDTGQFEEIYSTSANDLKGVATQKDFVALLEAVHRKLGNFRSTMQTRWHVNYGTSGTFVSLTYTSVYSEGEAVEQFVYRLDDEKALLAGYHISSNTLILK